jgi:hypothetical protein
MRHRPTDIIVRRARDDAPTLAGDSQGERGTGEAKQRVDLQSATTMRELFSRELNCSELSILTGFDMLANTAHQKV